MFDTSMVMAVENGGHDPRIRVFRCGNTVDTFAVLTDRYLVLVDTMVNLESIGAVMDTLAPDLIAREGMSRRSLLVVNTHGDWDHVWGNGLFAGPNASHPAPIIGHRRTAEVMASPQAADFLVSFQGGNPGQFDSARWCPPTVRFDEGMSIDGGDLTLELVPTPGHTPDHHSIWIPEIRTLLAGDAAELPFPHVSDPASLPTLRASLQRLEDMGAETVLYCHAPGVADPALIRHNIDYFDELERRCLAALSRDSFSSLEEDEDPSSSLGWPLEEALPPGVSLSDLSPLEFNQAGHRAAIRAMLLWLDRQGMNER